MGDTYPDRQKDEENSGNVIFSSKMSHKSEDNIDVQVSDCAEWALAKSGKPGRTFILKLIQSETCENLFQELFLKQTRALGINIPKQLVSLEEKHLKQCLEFINVNALQSDPCAVSLDTGFVSDHTSFGNRNFAAAYPMVSGGRDLVSGCEDEEIIGSIKRRDSMMNILSSPVFQKLGISNHDATHARLGGTKLFENKKRSPSPFDYQGSPGLLMLSPSQKPGKETGFRNHGNNRYDSVQKNPISDLASVLPMDDRSCESCSSQGTLQCTWDDGIPHFTFTLDDQKELYVANATRAEVIYEKSLDYIYSFHFRTGGHNLSDISGIEPDLVGKMKVSTFFSLCSGNSKVTETEFVLVGTDDNHARDIQPLSRNNRRSGKLSKVMDMFKAGPSHKQQTPSILGGSSANPRGFSVGFASKPELPEEDFLPNLELAAIVLKDHVQNEEHQEEVGGWGLKFLKKSRVKPTVIDSSDMSETSECCRCNVGNCSTSLEIIVPAGTHGGPRTRKEGPSSLIERWRSNGHCDCGGWDIGCPLKVLKARPIREAGRPNSEAQGDCRSFDMFIEGLEQAAPILKMVNIRDGLYFISFQSSFLSALQCFAIAVATIHSKSPSLRQN